MVPKFLASRQLEISGLDNKRGIGIKIDLGRTESITK